MAKKLLLFGIILVILLLGIGGYFFYKNLKPEQALSISGYYDEDGNEIIAGEQAVIGGVEGVKYITFKVNAKNTDTTSLNIKIISASPDKLNIALSSQEKIAEEGETVTWISDLVDIEEYEGTTQEFSVVVEASSSLRETIQKTSIISVLIEEDPDSSFDIEIVSETNNSEDIGEEETQTEIVYFRTTDLSYGSGSAIAFVTSCGDTLVGYGRESSGVDQDDSCESRFTNPSIIENLPGSLNENGDGNVKLFPDNTDSNEVWLCENRASTSTVSYIQRYDLTDSDASSVSNSLDSIDSTKEIFC